MTILHWGERLPIRPSPRNVGIMSYQNLRSMSKYYTTCGTPSSERVRKHVIYVQCSSRPRFSIVISEILTSILDLWKKQVVSNAVCPRYPVNGLYLMLSLCQVHRMCSLMFSVYLKRFLCTLAAWYIVEHRQHIVLHTRSRGLRRAYGSSALSQTVVFIVYVCTKKTGGVTS